MRGRSSSTNASKGIRYQNQHTRAKGNQVENGAEATAITRRTATFALKERGGKSTR